MRAGRVTVAGLLALAAGGCAKLPTVAVNECGNGVVEAPREDCDGFAAGKMSCRPKGNAGECHYDCRPRADGVPPRCPDGWGCDLEGLCREPSGEFETPAQAQPTGAWTLLAGDFDGDGRADIVGREPLDILARSKLRIHYLDDRGNVTDTRSFPKPVGGASVIDLTGDHHDDLVFSTGGLGVLLGQSDRSWLPESFGSYHLRDSDMRNISVSDISMPSNSPVVVLATVGGTPGLFGPDFDVGLRRLCTLPGGVELLAGDPVPGDLIADPVGSPCQEVVVAMRGATSFLMVDTCIRLDNGDLAWRTDAPIISVPLDPPAPIETGALIADVNGDGHLDVMLGAQGHPFVAYGDGHKLAPARPYQVRFNVKTPSGEMPPAPVPMPLAVGDFTGDGIEDFVFPDRLWFSGRLPGAPAPVYIPVVPGLAAPWTVARIADLNGNGKLDVVAASREGFGIDFFNGTDSLNLLYFNLPTDAPVLHLETGDMDGDLIADLAIIEAASAESGRDAVRVSFGNLTGAPSQPITVTRIKHAEQLAMMNESGVGSLLVTSRETIAGQQNAILSVLRGSGDRLPYAPRELVDINPAGQLRNDISMGAAVGAFTAPGQRDVLAFGSAGEPYKKVFSFWLLAGLSTTQNNQTLPVGGKVDPRVLPAQGRQPSITINMASAAADVDGDGRDDGLYAMSADENQRCALMVVSLTAKSPPEALVRDTVMLDERCSGPDVAAVDADGDGRPDVALLTGAPGEKTRKLLVLWNDGKGSFSTARATVVSGADSPQQFTWLHAIPSRPFSFAYVTDGAAIITSAAGGRAFGPARMLTSLPGGTGIVAADVNGDGVQDLALAASGNLSIWKARLKTQ